MRLYKVVPGDSLYVVAGKLLSSSRYNSIGALAQAIVAINGPQVGNQRPVDDWTTLVPGAVIVVPE